MGLIASGLANPDGGKAHQTVCIGKVTLTLNIEHRLDEGVAMRDEII